MGDPEDHIADTLRTIRGTTSTDNIKLLQDIVDLVIDGQDTEKSRNALESILLRIKQYGITIDSLYQDLLNNGVDSKEIENPIYNNDKLEKYTLPLIKDEGKKRQFAKEIADLRDNIKGYYGDYFDKGYNKGEIAPLTKQVDKLIGSLDGNKGGMLAEFFLTL